MMDGGEREGERVIWARHVRGGMPSKARLVTIEEDGGKQASVLGACVVWARRVRMGGLARPS